MDWPRLEAVLHTTGLWGRSYLGVGRRAASRTWQKLCQREDTGLPWGKPYHGRIHIWDYLKGNQAIRTPSPVQGLTGDPGELTPILGLASDCSAQSDCRGCLEDSTRVHRPGNWTGGEKRRSYQRVRGNGVASLTPASSSRPLPVTQHTGRKWLNAETVESCEGVRCHPARSSADVCQRGAVRQRMGGGNTQSGVSPPPQGARLALRLVHQGLHYPVGQPLFGDSLPFLLTSVAEKRAAQSFWSSGCSPRICAMLLWDTATLRLDLPPPRAVLAGSPPDRGRGWWEPWARNQAGVSRQRESRPARTQGTLWFPKTPGGPRPVWSECGQERCLKRQELQLDWVQQLKGAPLKSSVVKQTLVLRAPRPVERQGPPTGWGSGDTAGWYPLAVYRGAMPTSGPGSVASAEVVSYEAIRVAWLQLRMP